MESWAFWAVAGLMTLAVAALLLLAMLRGRTGPAAAATYDMRVYRDQLREVDRDLARGTVSEAEAERLRTEISRRLLEADRAAQGKAAGARAPRGLSLVFAGLTAAVLAGAFGLYWVLGAPGYPDLPLAARIASAEQARAARPGQDAAETAAEASRPAPPEIDPEFADLMARLREAVAERPGDLRGLALLAMNEARLGNFRAAYEAQEALIAARGDAATADDYTDLADLLIGAAGGYVSPRAEAALETALDLDPKHTAARYYYGLTFAQTGRPDLAFRLWRALLAESPPDAPWVPVIEAEMPALAAAAGERWSADEARGPTAADIDAAADMAPEDRAAMIRAMVDGLSDRLAIEGGPPEDWARLISALGVLGETADASAIWTEAQTIFADAPGALETVRAAAIAAGVAE